MDDNNTLPNPGNVTIHEFLIRVPIIELKLTSKIQFVSELRKLNTAGQRFRNYQCIEKRGTLALIL